MKPEAHLPVAEYAREHPVLKNPGETTMLDHLPQLDGVRAIAVGLVIWSHFQPRTFVVRGGPPWGAIGVGLFFTLSGFLITRILLNARLKIIDGKAGHGEMLRQFYIRRFLRIFPLYYGVTALLWVFNPTDFRDRFWYSIAYLTNYRFSYDGPLAPDRAVRRLLSHVIHIPTKHINWDQKADSIERHLWSLSVEEQFYIVWPFLILFCPRKLLLPVIILTIIAAPVWRMYTYTPGLQMHEWMTPGCLDLLGMGALLALMSLPRYNLSRWRDGFVQLCGLIGVPLIIAFVAQRWWPTVFPPAVREPTAVSFDWMDYGGAAYPITALAAVWIIGTAARGFRGPIGWFLTCPPVVYLGRISYGLYVLHMLMPHLIGYFVEAFPATNRRTWAHFFAYTGAALVAASLSWFLFESPMNKLKRYFEYDKSALTKSPTPAAAA